MTNEQLQKLAQNDPIKIIEALFYIENKNGQVVPFKLNDAQLQYYKQRTKRDDILKARQQGFSSLILALFTVDFLFTPNIWCACVSHESAATERLFRKVHNYIKRLPFTIPLDTSRSDMIVNKLNGSMFYIGTAGSKAFGQGDTIHRLHLSEFSRYPNAERLIKNIVPAVPADGIIVKETTANGMGNYHHREWNREKTNESVFRPFFSPWFATKEYQTPMQSPIAFTQEEKTIQRQYGLHEPQMFWRRMKISELGSEDSFKEQYPANDLEAFISSGASAFSKESLAYYYSNTCRKPVFQGVFTESATPSTQEDSGGYFKMWEKPLPNSVYFISADVGKSGDYCSATVWHWSRLEQVATIHGHFEPDYFGQILYKAGALYNFAFIIPENNGIGAGTVAALKMMDYRNLFVSKVLSPDNREVAEYGFNTNTRTRPLIISSAQKAIRDRSPIIRDEDYIIEMQSFQRNKDGKFEGATTENGEQKDDRVMCFAIGMYYYQTNPIPQIESYGRTNTFAMPDNSGMTNQFYQGTEGFDDFTT